MPPPRTPSRSSNASSSAGSKKPKTFKDAVFQARWKQKQGKERAEQRREEKARKREKRRGELVALANAEILVRPSAYRIYVEFCKAVFIEKVDVRKVFKHVIATTGLTRLTVSCALVTLRKQGLVSDSGKRGRGATHVPIPVKCGVPELDEHLGRNTAEVSAMDAKDASFKSKIEKLKSKVIRKYSANDLNSGGGRKMRLLKIAIRAYARSRSDAIGAEYDDEWRPSARNLKFFKDLVDALDIEGISPELYEDYVTYQNDFWQTQQGQFVFPSQLTPSSVCFYKRDLGKLVSDPRPFAGLCQELGVPRAWIKDRRIAADYNALCNGGQAGSLVESRLAKGESERPSDKAVDRCIRLASKRLGGVPVPKIHERTRKRLWDDLAPEREVQDAAFVAHWHEADHLHDEAERRAEEERREREAQNRPVPLPLREKPKEATYAEWVAWAESRDYDGAYERALARIRARNGKK